MTPDFIARFTRSTKRKPRYRVIRFLSNYYLERRVWGVFWLRVRGVRGGPFLSLEHAIAAIDSKPVQAWAGK